MHRPMPTDTLRRLLAPLPMTRGVAVLLAPTFDGPIVMEPPTDILTPWATMEPPSDDLTPFAVEITDGVEGVRA